MTTAALWWPQAINEMLREELGASRVVGRLVTASDGQLFFPVSNRQPESYNGLASLRTALEGIIGGMHVVKEPKPIRWIRLLNALRQARAWHSSPCSLTGRQPVTGRCELQVGEVATAAQALREAAGMDEEELRAALRFFHKLGEVRG